MNIQYFQQVIDNENIIHFQSHASATAVLNQMTIFVWASFWSLISLYSHVAITLSSLLWFYTRFINTPDMFFKIDLAILILQLKKKFQNTFFKLIDSLEDKSKEIR